MIDLKTLSKKQIIHYLGKLTATLWDGNTPLENDVDIYISALMGALAILQDIPANEVTFGFTLKD